MTSTPSEPRLYDVWLMWVEFPDHPGIGKPRPVVITEVDGDLVSGIVAKITGNTDWDEAGENYELDPDNLSKFAADLCKEYSKS